MKRISVLLGIFGVAARLGGGAQTYPSKPIRIVAPFPPGGVADVLARAIQPGLQEALGQQVIIDNKPGAGGNIGAEIVAKAEPDGHTLLLASAGILTINEFLYAKMPFDTAKAFAPITVVGDMPNIVVVHPKTGLTTLKGLIDKAKAEPGKLNFGSAGNGTTTHLAIVLLEQAARIKLAHVPYKGAAPAVQDLVAGQIDGLVDNPPLVLGHIQQRRHPRAGLGRAPAHGDPARRADRGRGGPAGLRGLVVVRPDGAGRHAAGDHGQAQRRDGEDPARIPRWSRPSPAAACGWSATRWRSSPPSSRPSAPAGARSSRPRA